MCKLVGLFVLVTVLIGINAKSEYKKYIPNGNNVPNPCTDNPTDKYSRVGHDKMNVKERNQFGVDFSVSNTSNVGFEDVWGGVHGLCLKDSDGDGRINGEELGDPDCSWTYRGAPKITDIRQLSHPGIKDKLVGGKLTMTPADRTTYC